MSKQNCPGFNIHGGDFLGPDNIPGGWDRARRCCCFAGMRRCGRTRSARSDPGEHQPDISCARGSFTLLHLIFSYHVEGCMASRMSDDTYNKVLSAEPAVAGERGQGGGAGAVRADLPRARSGYPWTIKSFRHRPVYSVSDSPYKVYRAAPE